MAEEIRIVLPKGVYKKIEAKAKEKGVEVNDLILMVLSKILEGEV